jgi:hypothetical protein
MQLRFYSVKHNNNYNKLTVDMQLRFYRSMLQHNVTALQDSSYSPFWLL